MLKQVYQKSMVHGTVVKINFDFDRPVVKNLGPGRHFRTVCIVGVGNFGIREMQAISDKFKCLITQNIHTFRE